MYHSKLIQIYTSFFYAIMSFLFFKFFIYYCLKKSDFLSIVLYGAIIPDSLCVMNNHHLCENEIFHNHLNKVHIVCLKLL